MTEQITITHPVSQVVEHPRIRKGPYYVGLATIVVAIVSTLSFAVFQWVEATRWDPLGDYPLQLASSPNTPGEVDVADPEQIPTIYMDQKITVTGVKCVSDDAGVVQVRDELWWVSDQPPAYLLFGGEGGGKRGPGCISATYRNPIPQNVRDAIDDMVAEGVTQSTWHLSGTEVPVKTNGDKGVERTWNSTSFVILHRNRE